jgi:predicted nucleic acid-binding protein
MGLKYLWDTNTVIYYLQGQFPAKGEKFIDDILSQSRCCISCISEIELLCWPSGTAADHQVLQDLLATSLVIELEPLIKYKAAEIRKQHNLKLPDALIASTGIVHNLNILTRNTRDFDKIPELVTVNPWEL